MHISFSLNLNFAPAIYCGLKPLNFKDKGSRVSAPRYDTWCKIQVQRIKRENYTWVERFNVQGSRLMSPNRRNPKDFRLPVGGN